MANNNMTEGSPAKLKSYVERLTNLANEKKTLAQDEKDVIAEAKAAGFPPKELRSLIKRLNMDSDQRAKQLEHEEAVDRLETVYRNAENGGLPGGRSGLPNSSFGANNAHAGAGFAS